MKLERIISLFMKSLERLGNNTKGQVQEVMMQLLC